MAIVDAKCRFTWASVGCPGNFQDYHFSINSIWQNIISGYAIPQMTKTIGESEVPPLIIGDSAFPFSVFLMKPFADGEPNEIQKYFNYRLSRA